MFFIVVVSLLMFLIENLIIYQLVTVKAVISCGTLQLTVQLKRYSTIRNPAKLHARIPNKIHVYQ